jgi:hypothetical protein
MTTLTTEAKIAADGTVTIVERLPGWVRAGHARVLLMVDDDANSVRSLPRLKQKSTPEMVAQRKKALASARRLNPYREVLDPETWQRETRRDRTLPFCG